MVGSKVGLPSLDEARRAENRSHDTTVAKTGASGIPWCVSDPAGRLARLGRTAQLRKVSRNVELLNGASGSLNPYALVREPQLRTSRPSTSPRWTTPILRPVNHNKTNRNRSLQFRAARNMASNSSGAHNS